MHIVRAKVLRASSGWKVVSKVAYGQNTIKANFSLCFYVCTSKKFEDKI